MQILFGGRLRQLRSTLVLASVLFAIMIVSTMASAAESYYVGVHVGAWAKYDINFQYVWQSQTEAEPPYLLDTNQTKWNNVTITAVSESDYNVTAKVTTHLKNNTERTATYQGDLLTGKGNLSFQVIVAGIQKGDPILIYPNFTGDIPWINETTSTSYAGANRQINFMRVEAGDVKNGEFLGSGIIYDYYWDRETGILCEVGTLAHDETALHNMTSYLTVKMTETNLWEPEPGNNDAIWWIVGFIIVVPAASIIFIGFRRRKKRHHISRYRSFQKKNEKIKE